MRFLKFNFSAGLFLVVAFAAHCSSVLADEQTSQASNPALTAPAPNSDRKDQGNGASAMALAASAMQQVMCMKMMADAARENNSEKMAMASALCAQAAANAANAAQNKDGASKVTSQPQQMPAAPTFEKAKIDTEPKPDNFDPTPIENEKNTATNASSPSPVEIAGATQNSDAGTVFKEDKTFKSPFSPLGLENATPPETSKISVAEGASGLGAQASNGMYPRPMTSQNSANGLLGSSNAVGQGKDPDAKVKKAFGKSSDAGSDGALSGNGSNFEDMMARFNAGSSGSGLGFGGGGLIDLAYGLQAPGQRMRNIFEFASDEYQKVKRNGSGLNGKSPARNAPTRALASQPGL